MLTIGSVKREKIAAIRRDDAAALATRVGHYIIVARAVTEYITGGNDVMTCLARTPDELTRSKTFINEQSERQAQPGVALRRSQRGAALRSIRRTPWLREPLKPEDRIPAQPPQPRDRWPAFATRVDLR